MARVATKKPPSRRCRGWALRTNWRCRNPPLGRYPFCRRHRFQPLWWLGAGTTAIVTIYKLTAIVAPGPPPATQQQASDILARIDAVERNTEEILKILKGADDIIGERLGREYPLGYSLFYAAAGKTEPERYPAPSADVEADWSQVKVVDWFKEPGLLFLSAPRVRDLRTGVGFEEIVVGLPRSATAATRLFGTDGLTLFGEVLESRAKELVFVLGLRRDPPG